LRPLRDEEVQHHDYLNDLFGTFRMCRGVSAVMKEVVSVLKMEGQPSSSGNPWAYDEESVLPTLATTYPQLPDLERLIVEDLDPEYQASALDATKRLFVGIRVLDRTSVDHSLVSLITRWPIHISESFLALCLARHPVALIILAYSAVHINKRTNMWFNERWPRLIINGVDGVDGVDGVLKGSQWERWIEWPRRIILSHVHV